MMVKPEERLVGNAMRFRHELRSRNASVSI